MSPLSDEAGRTRTRRTTPVRIVQLFGDLLGTYGDNGNTLVLERRASWRGVDVVRTEVTALDPIPVDGDIYVIGGGEDGPQSRAARLLSDAAVLGEAVSGGAAVLGVCAGFQILGRSFLGPDGSTHPGLGLLDVTTVRTSGPRLVGEVLVDTDPALGIGRLSGYENHAGVTRLGDDARPLGHVAATATSPGRTEGAHAGRVIGTYLHGPLLARNPALADRLLAWALDVEPDDLEPLDDTRIERLRRARTAAVTTAASEPRERPTMAARVRDLFPR